MSIGVTNLIKKIGKKGYMKMVNECIIPDFENDENKKIINIHSEIYPLTKISGQLYGCIMNDIIDKIIKKDDIDLNYFINNYPSVSFKYNSTSEMINEYAFTWFDEIIKDYFSQYNSIEPRVIINNNNICGEIDYICDDMILDLKCYRDGICLTYHNILQLILYYCLTTKPINKLGIYDFYNGNFIILSTDNINKQKILKYLKSNKLIL